MAEWAAVALAAASAAYNINANEKTRKSTNDAAGKAADDAAATTAASTASAKKYADELNAEAERERLVAISAQDAQNVRLAALAQEAAANEKVLAQNIAERAGEQSLVDQQAADAETARVKEAERTTMARQIASLAGAGVSLADETGTPGALLMDTKTKASKDVAAVETAVGAQKNLLAATAANALEQGAVSSKNILASAEHQIKTNTENVKNAADTLVANAKIGADTAISTANLNNLMTLASADKYYTTLDQLKSTSNASMWNSLLNTSSSLLGAFKTQTDYSSKTTTPKVNMNYNPKL